MDENFEILHDWHPCCHMITFIYDVMWMEHSGIVRVQSLIDVLFYYLASSLNDNKKTEKNHYSHLLTSKHTAHQRNEVLNINTNPLLTMKAQELDRVKDN